MPPVKKKPQSVAAIEAKLLKLVRAHERISRVDLSRKLKIAASTAGIYVDRLIAEGFLLESEKTERRFGRPATLLALNPQGGRFVGVDFEARNIMAAAVDFSQNPLQQAHVTIRAKDSAEAILERIEETIEKVIGTDSRPVLGIGIGVPGTIDPASGLAVKYPFIKGWQNIPLSARVRDRFGAPVFLENNIRSMALAEMWFGCGRGRLNFLTLGVRSGVAAGVVVNGTLLRGSTNQGGEIGQWSCPVPKLLNRFRSEGEGEEWLWRKDARLEEVASLSAILERIEQAIAHGQKTSLAQIKGDLSIEDLLAAVRAGDEYATSLIRAVAQVHGWVVCQLHALFDPEQIIFAGPLTELGDLFLKQVEESAREHCGEVSELRITCSTLGKYNGALGAAALALNQWKPKR